MLLRPFLLLARRQLALGKIFFAVFHKYPPLAVAHGAMGVDDELWYL